jgi:protein SCO1/2
VKEQRLVNESAQRTTENSPATYRWVGENLRLVQSAKRTTDLIFGSALFSRPFHGLSELRGFSNPALKCWATFNRPRRGLRVWTLIVLLLTAHCLLLTAQAQIGGPGPSSPLYGARPETGKVSTGLPPALQKVGIDQKLNEQLPLDAVFKDESGNEVKLGQYFGKRPVILSLVYYSCPMLCNQVMNGMVGAFKGLAFVPGDEFDVVTISFDARETATLAAAKKKTYVEYFPAAKQATIASGWHFLTGDETNIRRVTDAVGFRYNFDAATNQFAHASGIMVVTPEGKLSHYFYGIEYSPKDLRLGLVQASANKIGTPVDQLLLYCYHYDPSTGKYGAVVMNMVRVGGIVTVLGMAGVIGMFLLGGAGVVHWKRRQT